MSINKLFVISTITFIYCWLMIGHLDSPEQIKPFASGSTYSKKDTPYTFRVPNDGQIMLFEVKGSVAMNSWKSIDIEIYDAQGNYLFAYTDELWAESGRDSDGRWTEYHTHLEYKQRFPSKGEYVAYIHDMSSSRNAYSKSSFNFRILALNGDSRKLKVMLWISGVIAVICLLIIMHRYENGYSSFERKRARRIAKEAALGMSTEPMQVKTAILLFAVPTFFLTLWAMHEDDADIDWLSYSHSKRHIYVDKQLREHSLKSAQFRTGSGRGGK